MTNRTGRGRPNKAAYVTSWGQTIEGAYKGKDGGRIVLRPIGKTNPKFSLNDETRAVHKFLKWQSEQGRPPQPKVPVSMPTTLNGLDVIAGYPEREPIPASVNVTNQEIITDVESIRLQERNRLRHLIMLEPKQAAIELDFPPLAFHPVIPDKPQCTLIELGERYLNESKNSKGDPLNAKHKKNSKRMWNEFCKYVGVKYARDLTDELITNYFNFIHAKTYEKLNEETKKHKTVGIAAATKRNFFRKIHAILSWGIRKVRKDQKDLRMAWDLCDGIFDSIEVESNPKPFEPKHFNKLLKHADKRMKAILLLALNGAFHGGEVVEDTYMIDIDFVKRTYAGRRGKNNRPRVAKLWKRTVDAIKDYLEEHPHNNKHIFCDYPVKDKPYIPLSSNARRIAFMALREKVGLPKEINMEGLRDAAFGTMEETDSHHAKFVAGHPTGESEKYVLRQAKNKQVIKCCNAVEKEFFG